MRGREGRVDEQTPSPGLRVNAHHRVHDRFEHREPAARPHARPPGRSRRCSANSARPSCSASSPSTSARTGALSASYARLQVCEGGVAADGRDHHAGEERAERWVRHEGHVGVPRVVLPLVPVARVGARARRVDLEHLRVLRVDRRHHRVRQRELAEQPAGRDQLVRAEVLAGEHQHLVLGQRPAELFAPPRCPARRPAAPDRRARRRRRRQVGVRARVVGHWTSFRCVSGRGRTRPGSRRPGRWRAPRPAAAGWQRPGWRRSPRCRR